MAHLGSGEHLLDEEYTVAAENTSGYDRVFFFVWTAHSAGRV